MEEGSYTCLIPSRYVHVLCLPPGTSQGPEATLAVDDLKVRVMLMEAEQRSLRAKNGQLAKENQFLAHNVSLLQQDNQELKEDNAQLKANVQQLDQDNQRFEHNVSSLQQDKLHLQADILQLKADNQRFTHNISSVQHSILQLRGDNQGLSALVQGKEFTRHLGVVLLNINSSLCVKCWCYTLCSFVHYFLSLLMSICWVLNEWMRIFERRKQNRMQLAQVWGREGVE